MDVSDENNGVEIEVQQESEFTEDFTKDIER